MEQLSYTHEELSAMRNTDIRTIDPASLQDIQEVTVNQALPKEERMQSYLQQIGNPYCYRCGKYAVKVSFSNSERTLEDCLLAYLRSKC